MIIQCKDGERRRTLYSTSNIIALPSEDRITVSGIVILIRSRRVKVPSARTNEC